MFRVYSYLILAQDHVHTCACKQERRGGRKQEKSKDFGTRWLLHDKKVRCEQYNNAAIMCPNVSKLHNIDILQLN